MIFLVQATLSGLILGLCAWASNLWPGVKTWPRAAASRLMWWGAPFAGIALLNDVVLDHALILGAAAWMGAWIPHTAMPDVRAHLGDMLTDMLVTVLRVTALLALPTGVFWTCGAYWYAMVMAVLAALPCVLAGNIVTLPLPGLATPRHMAGALFGASTGVWLAVVINMPDPLPDLLR